MTEAVLQDQVRAPREVALRSLALSAAVVVALGGPRSRVCQWVREENLQEWLTPQERAYLASEDPPQRDTINFSWQSERLLVLLWALGKTERVPPSSEQCDTRLFLNVLPPNAAISASEFLVGAQLREDDQLYEMADHILNDHWKARDAKLHDRPAPEDIDIEIVQERHHAVNWIIGYDGLHWDEVTTDT